VKKPLNVFTRLYGTNNYKENNNLNSIEKYNLLV